MNHTENSCGRKTPGYKIINSLDKVLTKIFGCLLPEKLTQIENKVRPMAIKAPSAQSTGLFKGQHGPKAN